MADDPPPNLTISFPNGDYAESLRQRRSLMLWIASEGIAHRGDIDGRLATAYQGQHYSKKTIEDPLDSGWSAYIAFWCDSPGAELWLRSCTLPAGARVGPPDP